MSTSSTLKFQHSSLQFSDNAQQQEQDIRDLFRLGEDFPIKTGTEAGPDAVSHNANRRLLQQYAAEANHRLTFWRDNWIAVDKAIIKPKSVVLGSVFVADNDETKGRGHDSGFVTMAFEHIEPGVGEINLAACHLPTQGRDPRDPNYDINARYSDYLGRWARKAAKGSALAFVIGDYNRPDTKDRNFLIGDQHLTSAPDEVGGPWQNTGHGPIDGMMSYDGDGRVKAKWVNVLTDKEFFQHSDHLVVRAAYDVRHKRVA